MGFGAVFLLAFAGGLADLYSLRPALVTPAGVVDRARRLRIGAVAMAVAAWGTVFPLAEPSPPAAPRHPTGLLVGPARTAAALGQRVHPCGPAAYVR
jgi:hypothetical protein